MMRYMPIAAAFGASVRSRRFRLGMSQEALAERAGLHRTYIAGIERGARNLTLKNIEKLAQALQTSIGVLLGESDKSSNAPGLLLVEDDAKDVELTLEAFQQARLTNPVHVARDGQEALDFLFGTGKHATRRAEKLPEIVLLDLQLPKVHGLEVLRRIKSDKQRRTLHVIVLTASRKDEEFREALRLGASAYILKPVAFEDFCRITPKLSFEWTLSARAPGA